ITVPTFFKTPAVGLDIDRGAIKAVQVSRSSGSYALQHVGYRRLPPGAVSDGEGADHDLLSYEIKEFWASHSFKGKAVYLGVANQKVVVRLLDFPRMSPEDLKSAIGFEAQDQIPMPIDEAVLDYVVLGPQEEGSDLDRILIVAAQQDMISRYSSAVRAAGLRPEGVDVKALSLLRSTLPLSLFDDEGAILLLDIGAEITSLVVSQSGTPTLTRFIPGGSGYLAQAVAEAASLPEEEAERQLMNPKVRIGSEPEGEIEGAEEDGDDFDPALVYDIRHGLEDAVQALAEDVQRSVEYHYSQPGSREVTQVFISGEGALVNGLDAYLGDLLGVATHRGTPLSKLASNKSNVPDEQLRVMEPILAVALGLALEEA
ncbi:MAG TPA: type IV pilus assembly protein PilM, partial [Rubrobacteraceae bacterium]|nr:type IV pilus assembly protein PilM [Rubrobacteraceae bacterium]